MPSDTSVTTKVELTLFRCPACHGEFERAWQCANCKRKYASVHGVPDLRWPPVVDTEPALSTVQEMLTLYDDASFETLCQARLKRWVMPDQLEQHYLHYRLTNLERGEKMARMFQQRLAASLGSPRAGIVVDLGCGSGAATLSLGATFSMVIALDWNLADLLLLRKRLDELQVSNVWLVQANLLNQPIADSQVDYVTALNVIEHMLDVRRGFSEVARTLRPGGYFCGDSRNRFDILFPEPHVKLRGIGYLPRDWAKRYIRWRRGLAYNDTRLLSYWELRAHLAACFDDYRIVYPRLEAYHSSSRFARWLVWYETRLSRLAALTLPLFTTLIAIGHKR